MCRPRGTVGTSPSRPWSDVTCLRGPPPLFTFALGPGERSETTNPSSLRALEVQVSPTEVMPSSRSFKRTLAFSRHSMPHYFCVLVVSQNPRTPGASIPLPESCPAFQSKPVPRLRREGSSSLSPPGPYTFTSSATSSPFIMPSSRTGLRRQPVNIKTPLKTSPPPHPARPRPLSPH